MPETPELFRKWDVTPQELAEIIQENPSLRGVTLGYLAEYKLRKLWLSDERILDCRRPDAHDRREKADFIFKYREQEIKLEVKSLQTNSIRRTDDQLRGVFQCDASDRRPVKIPGDGTVETTCLLVGEFDLLAVNLFSFEDKWRFAFARNRDLPRSPSKKYTPKQRRSLIATSIDITWPLKPPFEVEPYRLLDEIVRECRR